MEKDESYYGMVTGVGRRYTDSEALTPSYPFLKELEGFMRSRDEDAPEPDYPGEKPPAVHGELGTLRTKVDRLNSLIDQLDERLSPVRNPEPRAEMAKESATTAGSPVRQTVSLITDTVIGMAGRVERILGELEI